VDFRRFSNEAERSTLVSLQGLANKAGPTLWMDHIGLSHYVLPLLQRDGWELVDLTELSLAELAKKYRGSFDGVIFYSPATINLGTSLSGVQNSLLMQERIYQELYDLHLPVRGDARQMSYAQFLAQHGTKISPDLLVEQRPRHATFLRDFAISHNLLTYYDISYSALRKLEGSNFSPNAQVFGWGKDEQQWVNELSKAGAVGVPTEYFLNLSALPCLSTNIPDPPQTTPRAVDKEEDATFVAFVLTDGDNISWMASDFIDDSNYWASPLRGKIPFTWELSPTLAVLAPYYLRYFYEEARQAPYADTFVAGMGSGYTFPSKNPQRLAYAAETAALMAAAKLRILSIIDDEGSLEDAEIFLRQATIDAVLYKDFSPYNGHHGEIAWFHGKPVISYKYLLWEGIGSPEEVAHEITSLTAQPRRESTRFVVVGVHAWSHRESGGPLAAVKKTMAQRVKVVAAEELVRQLRENMENK
jgi:hypothetical protein